MVNNFCWLIMFLLGIFLSCETKTVNGEMQGSNELLSETDTSICILKKDVSMEVCTVYYNKNLNKIKSINYYSVEDEKTWVKGVRYYQEGHVDSLFSTQNGLFTVSKRYTPKGELYEKSEHLSKSGNINQYWYFKESGDLMKDYGCFHEISVINISKERLSFQVFNVHEPNCIGDIRLDLHIGNYNDDFDKITDSTGFQVLNDIKLNDTISIDITNNQKDLRYILKIQCKQYISDEKDNYNNVTVPIVGVLTRK